MPGAAGDEAGQHRFHQVGGALQVDRQHVGDACQPLKPAIGAGAAGNAGIGHQQVDGKPVVPGMELRRQCGGVTHVAQRQGNVGASPFAGSSRAAQGGPVAPQQPQRHARRRPGARQGSTQPA